MLFNGLLHFRLEAPPHAPTELSPPEVQRLGDQIAEFSAHMHAATHHWLVLLLQFERGEGWGGGFASCSHWLSWRTGTALGPAREYMRVARAIESLPGVSEGLRTGALSYCKVRAVTRIATPENEGRLLDFAKHATVSQLERMVRAWRHCDQSEEIQAERARHASRHLSLVPDGDGMYDIRGKLDPEVAAVLERALEEASWKLYRKSSEEERATPVAARRADAIGLVAEQALARCVAGEGESPERGADRHTVMIHADEGALRESGEGDAILDDGTRVSYETSRRLACDAGRVVMTHASDGSILDVGRKTRTVPPALRRALDHRDGGCRFPGCGNQFCDAHHVRHWADGGATRRDNLVLLCRFHHRAVHEEGFSVQMVDGVPEFSAPDGRRIPAVPRAPALVPDPVSALTRANDEAGLTLGPWSAAPHWSATKLDLDWAVMVLRQSA